ncbi:MAG TPA: hypothetical protein VGG28_05525 [Kofleriaceae bacterium]|jgi:hypothetical protein
MKLVVAIAVCFTFTLSCSIDKRSGAFSCTSSDQCDTGRVCVDGFCVVSGGSGTQIDAPQSMGGSDAGGVNPPPDGSTGDMCPAQCTTCSVAGKTCEIDCTNDTCNDNGPLQCPDGYSCTIACGALDSCNDIDCTKAKACTVSCSGHGACQEVDCGTGECDITCTGHDACGGTIDCSQSCACDVTCGSGSTATNGPCQGDITCQGVLCSLDGTGCSSQPPGCNTCQ